MCKTKQELISKMREQITRSDAMAQKALLRLYEYQTTDEKEINDTVHHNDVGFTGSDARWMTWAAKAILSGKGLCEWHYKTLRGKIGKYACQLVQHSINKGLIRKEGKSYTWVK